MRCVVQDEGSAMRDLVLWRDRDSADVDCGDGKEVGIMQAHCQEGKRRFAQGDMPSLWSVDRRVP